MGIRDVRILVVVLVAMLFAVLILGYRGQAEDVPMLPVIISPGQVATLHWYAANQTTQFSLGGGYPFPTGLAFDGENLWVANEFANAVIKLRPSDRSILATYPVPDPYVIVYDGANLWTADCNGGTVKKFDRATAPSSGVSPLGVAYLRRSLMAPTFGSALTTL